MHAEANFSGAEFTGETHFAGANFTGRADFHLTWFGGITFFVGHPRGSKTIFLDTEVDFSDVVLEPLDALKIRNADLRKCSFLGTDLRKAEFTGVMWPKIEEDVIYDVWAPLEKSFQRLKEKFKPTWSMIDSHIPRAALTHFERVYCKLRQKHKPAWPEIGRREGVYDEIVRLEEGESREWSHIEQVYRQLKQNCEDRKDYERAGDFHYGEKEMRRKNQNTTKGLRFLLTLYGLVSGYGERYGRPLVCAAAVLAVCAVLYLFLGLQAKNGGPTLSWMSFGDWLRSAFYSFRVMTVLRPEDFAPIGCAKLVHAFQSLMAPVLLGLFALALRQKLKR